MPHPPDILIAGAGPAGSATAVHLARAGYRVLLVDRAAFPREKPCSEYLSPEAVRHLADLGVLATLERDGAQPLFGTRVLGPRGARLEGRFSEASVRPFRDAGLALPRRILDQRLVEAAVAAGATLCERTMVEELLHVGGGVAGAVLREASGARRTVSIGAAAGEGAAP